MNRLSRRQVLALGGLALTAGGVLVGARSLRDTLPPGLLPGAPLPVVEALPLRRPEPGRVEATLVAARTPAVLAGQPVQTLTYNGYLPGPLLRLREGEHVRLTFKNQLDLYANLHLHGLHISPAVDAPFTHLMPGETRVYEFVVPSGSAGTYWYHPHPHGQVASQLFAGLAGPLIVEGGDEPPELRAAEDHLLVLKDYSVNGGRVSGHSLLDLNGKEGRLLTVNGAWRPVLSAKERTVRLRLVNASTARYYRLQLEEHPLHLIATDGGFIERPVEVEELLLAPGERAEVLVQLRSGGRYELIDLGYDREGGKAAATPLLTVRAPTGGQVSALPSRLVSVEALATAQTRVRTVTLNQSFPMSFGMNGRAFDEHRVDLQAREGTLEVWDLVSRSDASHPFHLHSYPFQVVSRGGQAEPFRAWRDVVNVRSRETVRIAIPLRDFGGTTVFHCHIAEHEDHGMMGVLRVLT